MDLIKHRKKIRALDILSRIQSFEMNNKITELDKQLAAEKQSIALHGALKNHIASFDSYQQKSVGDIGSQARHELGQQYIESLLNKEFAQQTMVASNRALTEELSKDMRDTYNLHKNVEKKLKSERVDFHRAVELYDTQL